MKVEEHLEETEQTLYYTYSTAKCSELFLSSVSIVSIAQWQRVNKYSRTLPLPPQM